MKEVSSRVLIQEKLHRPRASVPYLELAFGLESLSHGLWHGRRRRAWQTESNLDRVVDEPLQGGERTNHEDTRTETSPAALPAEVLEHLAGRSAWRLVEHRDDAVGWVGDDRAEDTGNVTGGKGDHELLALGALSTRLRYDGCVDDLNGLLKAAELHHGVRDLAEPEWLEALVERIAACWLSLHLSKRLTHVVSVAWHGLDSHLHGLKWREEHISEELSRGGSGQVKRHSVGVCGLFADSVAVHQLEHLVEAELTDTLGRVSDQSRRPTLGQALDTILGESDLETLTNTAILCWVDLNSAFDEIERHDSRVRDTARQGTTDGAERIELASSDLARVLGFSHFQFFCKFDLRL